MLVLERGSLQPTEEQLWSIATVAANLPSHEAWAEIFRLLRLPVGRSGCRMNATRAGEYRGQVWRLRDKILRSDPVLRDRIQTANREARLVNDRAHSAINPVGVSAPAWMSDPNPTRD